jgi:hypothetical protein
LTTEVLNHLLTSRFLEEKCRYYENLVNKFNTEEPFNPEMREFLLNRAAFLREDLQKHLGLGETFLCRLAGPKGVTFQIDGYWEKNVYQGWYYKDTSISVKVGPPHENRLLHWVVDGRIVNDRILRHPVKQDTDIRAVFKKPPDENGER